MDVLVLDLVVDVEGGRSCAIAAMMPTKDKPTSCATWSPAAWPPNLRHANPRALDECIKTLLGDFEAWPRRTAYRVFDTSSERADVALLELLEWHAYAIVAEGATVDAVLIPERAAVRGEGAQPALRVDGDDVARVMLQANTLATALDLNKPGQAPTQVVTYGVPHTPWAQAVIRAFAFWELSRADDPSHEQLSSPASLSAALPRLRALSALVAQGDLHAYALAETRVWFDRLGGQDGDVGGELAAQALDSAWRGPPDPDQIPRHAAALRRTLGIVAGVLDARAGDYEAPEEILKRVFDPGLDGAGSRADVLLGRQAFAMATALAQRAFVANHRGDSQVAREALARAHVIASQETSLRSAQLRLECLTFMAVACQDAWPYEAPGTRARDDLLSVEQRLSDAVAEFRQMVQLVPAREPVAPGGHLDLGELGAELFSGLQDPTLGAAMGTLGRTRALLGDHDAATHMLLEARAQFATGLDRAVNAAFLAHLELDRGPRADAVRLERVLATYVQDSTRTPAHAANRLRAGDLGFRFTLDIVLKTLAFGLPLRGTSPGEWQDALRGDELYELLATQLSHPTEQLGRHAGELLQRAGDDAAAERWFALSIRVAEAGGPAMKRSAVFTRLLAQHGAGAATGPRGCLTNPCYAQR